MGFGPWAPSLVYKYRSGAQNIHSLTGSVDNEHSSPKRFSNLGGDKELRSALQRQSIRLVSIISSFTSPQHGGMRPENFFVVFSTFSPTTPNRRIGSQSWRANNRN